MRADVDAFAGTILQESVARDGRSKTFGGTATIRSHASTWTVTFHTFLHQGGCQVHGSVTPTG